MKTAGVNGLFWLSQSSGIQDNQHRWGHKLLSTLEFKGRNRAQRFLKEEWVSTSHLPTTHLTRPQTQDQLLPVISFSCKNFFFERSQCEVCGTYSLCIGSWKVVQVIYHQDVSVVSLWWAYSLFCNGGTRGCVFVTQLMWPSWGAELSAMVPVCVCVWCEEWRYEPLNSWTSAQTKAKLNGCHHIIQSTNYLLIH